MAEVFWNKWFDLSSTSSIDYLFDAILLKKETPFPDHIIVPEFNENEKIVLTTFLPPWFSKQHNDVLLYLFSKILEIIPEKTFKTILLSTSNEELISIWKNKYSFTKTLKEDCFIETKVAKEYISPFSTKKLKKEFLNQIFLPYSIDQADQIIPIVPFLPSSLFKVSGVISSFFWFLPTKTKNEILIQNTTEQRTSAFMEIIAILFPKITISGSLYQGVSSFTVFGNDPVSVDAFSSALMSVKASSVPTTKFCRKNRIGMGDLLKIHVQGERFKKPVVKDQLSYKDRFLLYFDPEKCNLCNLCLDLCPLKVIFNKDSLLMYRKTNCNFCGLCVAICPKKAIYEI